MQKMLFVLALTAAAVAIADTTLKNAGVSQGAVLSLDCAADGGLFCSRANGSSTGSLRCASATLNTPGCVSTGPQSLSGTKILDGGLMVNGPTWFDGGSNINGSLIVDGGVTAKTGVSGASVISRGGFYFFSIRSDGGVLYINDDNSGKLGVGAQGAYFLDSASIPHSSQLCGYYPGTPIANPVSVVSQRFSGAGQFLRLSATVLRAGSGDGGLQVDGGPSQGWYVDVYDTTTGVKLCGSNPTQCQVSAGVSSSTCGADGGAFNAYADDVEIRTNMLECLIPPLVNFCAEYNGPP